MVWCWSKWIGDQNARLGTGEKMGAFWGDSGEVHVMEIGVKLCGGVIRGEGARVDF